MALKPTTGALLVNFALFDADGKVTAKLNDSTLMINEKRAYEVKKTPKSLLLTHLASGTVILQMECEGADVVAFTKGEFHTIKGHVIRGVSHRMENRQAPCQRHDARCERRVGRPRLKQGDRVLSCDRRHDDDLLVFQIHGCRISIAQFTLDQLTRHRRFNLLLDQSLQGSRPIDRIVTALTQMP